MAAIMVALVVGGLAGAVLLWPYGWACALIGAPFGASGLALLVSLLRFVVRSRFRNTSRRNVDEGTAAANDG